jgi:hypothetical protein
MASFASLRYAHLVDRGRCRCRRAPFPGFWNHRDGSITAGPRLYSAFPAHWQRKKPRRKTVSADRIDALYDSQSGDRVVRVGRRGALIAAAEKAAAERERKQQKLLKRRVKHQAKSVVSTEASATSSGNEASPFLPPTFLYATASPYVYVAKMAVDDGTYVSKKPATSLTPRSGLLSSAVTFRYCPPSSFPNHELPTARVPEIAVLGTSVRFVCF